MPRIAAGWLSRMRIEGLANSLRVPGDELELVEAHVLLANKFIGDVAAFFHGAFHFCNLDGTG